MDHRATIPVNERTAKRAERVAERYGISVAELTELLLLEFVDRADDASLPAPERRGRRVIDLDSERRRRASA